MPRSSFQAPSPPPPMDGAAIAKLLASPHTPTRDRAVRALSAWLSSAASASASDADLLKAWKGLFYCLWHCDGVAAQSALSSRLAALIPALPPPLSARFLATALSTLRREWPGLDLLRLDKFYLLLRRLLRHTLLLLRSHAWEPHLSAQFTAILSEKALLSADNYVTAQGVAYHLAEVFLDELRDFLPLSTNTLEILFNPFINVLEKSKDKVLVNKVKANIFERLLGNGAKLLSAGDEGGELEKFGKVGLLLGWSNKFFESASREGTVQGNRKVLFGLHQVFLKLEKYLEKSGLEFSLPKAENGSSEMVVMEIAEKGDGELGNGGVGLDGGKPLKKRKKVKEDSVMENSEEGDVHVGNREGVLDGNAYNKKKKNKEKGKETSVTEILEEGDEHVGNGDGVSDGNASGKKKKKKKKDKEELGGVEEKREAEKKKKKKKNRELKSVRESIGAEPIREIYSAEPISEIDIVDNVESVNVEVKETDDLISFNETLISNLQKQFEKVAAEAGMANGRTSSSDLTPIPVAATVPKKRKRSKSLDKRAKVWSIDASGESTVGKSGEKSVKKVTFSIKNNLVWKPHSPLPPESLRLPPSATPRGSALKKGVPPGPISGPVRTVKKVKVKANSAKKARKSAKAVSPAVKHLRKLQSFSV